MRRRLCLIGSLALLVTSAAAATAEPAVPAGQSEATAGIRIGLPAGAAAGVSVSFGVDRLALDLPRGAEFPDDFVAASNGLLRAATARPEGERVKLELEVAPGTLQRISYEPQAVMLYFRSRYAILDEALDPEDQYLLGPDDKLLVTVYNHEDLTGPRVIGREGTITIAHVGDVRAAGLTPRQLAARLGEVLSSILVDPRVDVSVEEYRSQWVIVSGEVHKLGRVPLHGGTRLKEVLGESGGFTEEAGEEITISRRVPGSDRTVAVVVERADYESGLKNPTLQHGDIVDVRRAEYCYIQGEVNDPGRLPIGRGMTLLRMISMAKGLTDWADKKNVKVRYPVGTTPAERVYNLKRILENKLEDPLIHGGEVIIVPRRFL